MRGVRKDLYDEKSSKRTQNRALEYHSLFFLLKGSFLSGLIKVKESLLSDLIKLKGSILIVALLR